MTIGKEIHGFARQLWPLNRSLTGEGVRETLRQISIHLPTFVVHSVSSGTQVFDWNVPKEWLVREAYIITPSGKKICDISKNNLHLLSYSTPFEGNISLHDLKKHLYTLPEQPDAIPYITSFYEERWGFCLSQYEFDKLKDGTYKVKIDTKLFDGKLNYGELIIPGETKEEVFLSTNICHPSMANNEISGIAVLTYIAKWLSNLKNRRYTYRLVFIPETIGSLVYLSRNLQHLKRNVAMGFNVCCIGDNRKYSYLPSRNGNTASDSIAKHVLKNIDPNFTIHTWFDRGSDERQYCAPGIDLPIASIHRTKYGEYPEYHTSLDNLDDVVTAEGLNGGYSAIRKILELIEKNKKFKVTVFGEPQLGKRGLFPTLSTKKKLAKQVMLMLDFISLCDGNNSLLDIADRLCVPAWDLYELVDKLEAHNLIVSNK
jgi:aminopeptidase-like protein